MSTRVSALVAALALAFASVRAEDPKKEAKVKPPTYQAPKGWEVLDPGDFATARFRLGEGDTAVQMTLTELKGDGGGLVANVNRWRKQVGLKELDEKDAKKAPEPIKVDGLAGHLIDVTGPDVDGKVTQRVVAVMVPHDGRMWFVRIGGPAVDVAEHKKVFDEFVKALRFPK